MTKKVLGCSLLGSALLLSLANCGGVTAFQGGAAQSIVGALPAAPPPPPPPKVEEPPPRVEVRDNKIVITEKIQFEYNKAIIKTESNSLLNEIVAVIKKNAHIKKISIEGHASAEGSASRNKKLSDERAKAVMAYLVEHGIEQPRLTAKGWGVEKPIADNNTEDGKEKNRRVEFNIVEQDVTKRKVEIDPATGKEKKVIDQSTESLKTEEAAPPAAQKPEDQKKDDKKDDKKKDDKKDDKKKDDKKKDDKKKESPAQAAQKGEEK